MPNNLRIDPETKVGVDQVSWSHRVEESVQSREGIQTPADPGGGRLFVGEAALMQEIIRSSQDLWGS